MSTLRLTNLQHTDASDPNIVLANDRTAALADGTASAPALSFQDDLDTGLYSPGANSIALGVGGSPILTIASDGTATFTGAATFGGNLEFTSSSSSAQQEILFSDGTSGRGRIIYRHNGDSLAFETFSTGAGTNEAMRIDSSKRLLIGTASTPAGTDAQYAKFALRGNTLNTNACYLSLGNNKNTADTTDDDNLGIITFNDNDSDAGEYARIIGAADGGNGTDDYPGKLVFATTADGQLLRRSG